MQIRSTAHARRKLAPRSALPVGERTLANARESSITYRFVGSGPVGSRRIVADSERARQLAATPAGPRIERALRRAVGQTAASAGANNLRSITLVPDIDALAGVYFLDRNPRTATRLDPQGRTRALARLRSTRAEVARMDGVAGAFNDGGAIFLMPQMSRALLAAVGAYRPHRSEELHRYGEQFHAFVPQLLRHEMEHSVTPPGPREYSPGLVAFEEGAAETLTLSRSMLDAARRDLPSYRKVYGDASGLAARVTEGWGPHDPPRGAASRTTNETYDDRKHLVSNLLRLAGIERDSDAGYLRARRVLQGGTLAAMPDRIARAIAEHHDVPAAKLAKLRALVAASATSTASDPLKAIRALL